MKIKLTRPFRNLPESPLNHARVKVIAGFATVFALILVAGWVSFRSLSSITNTVRQVTAPNNRVTLLREMLYDISTAESAVRAYAVDENANYLVPYYRFVREDGNKLDTLRNLYRNEPETQPILDSLSAAMQAKFAVFSELLDVQNNGEIRQALALLMQQMDTTTAGGADKNVMQKIRGLLGIRTRTDEEGPRQLLKQTSEHNDESLKKEKVLLAADKRVMEQIRSSINTLELLESAKSVNQARLAAAATHRATGTIGIIITLALFFLLLFIYFILHDLRQNIRLTERLRIARRKAEQLARLKEEFLANMSHEIRTPLYSISGYSNRLLKNQQDPKSAQYVEAIHHSSEHLLAVVNEILDYSKLESGQVNPEHISFQPDRLIRDVYLAMLFPAQEKKLDFRYSWQGEPALSLLGDPYRLRQVLMNLASNAIKFTDRGWVEIRGTWKQGDGNHGIITFEVEDSGMGIPAEKTEAIFESFQQADSSITRTYGGTGLGLSISRKITQLLGGTLSLQSEPGHGSIFRVQVPLETGGEEAPFVPEEALPDDLLHGRKILLVDDDVMNREIGSMLLSHWKPEIHVARIGREALDLLHQQPFDLVLMDVQMPGLSGYETTLKIRGDEDKRIATVPVIALTASPLADRQWKEAGMNGFILKPFDEAHFYRTLVNALGLASQKSRRAEPAAPGVSYSLAGLEKIASGNDAFVREMVETFLRNTPENLQLMQQYVSEARWSELERTAHKMAPSFKHFQMMAQAEMLKKIELQSKRTGGKEFIQHLLQQLTTECLRTMDFMREEISRKSAQQKLDP